MACLLIGNVGFAADLDQPIVGENLKLDGDTTLTINDDKCEGIYNSEIDLNGHTLIVKSDAKEVIGITTYAKDTNIKNGTIKIENTMFGIKNNNWSNPDKAIFINVKDLILNNTEVTAITANHSKVDIKVADELRITNDEKVTASQNGFYATAEGTLDVTAGSIYSDIGKQAAKVESGSSMTLTSTDSNGGITLTTQNDKGKGAIDVRNGSDKIKLNTLSITSKGFINIVGTSDDSTKLFKSAGISILNENSNVAENKVIINAEKDVLIKGDTGININSTVYDSNKNYHNQLEINSNTKIKIEAVETGKAINAISGADVKINKDGKADVVIDGDIIVNAKGENDRSNVNVNFATADSVLNGKITTGEANATTIIGFANGAKWNVTGDSKVTTLEGNNANIILSDTNTKVEIAENKNTGVNVESTGELSDANANDIQGMMNKLAGNVKVESGVTDKTVTAGEGLIVGETSAKYEGDKMVAGSLVEKVNTVNGAISDAGAIGLMTWRNEMSDMNKRLGELRGNEAEHGVWVRMINGELEYAGLENDTKSYQLGYDEKLSTDPRWTVGVSLNYTEGDTTGDKVSAENDHKGFAVYGSKLNEDGSYLDLIAKYARLDHEFTVRDGAKGEWNANGYSVSAEYGKRFTQESGLWYEPQVELTYGTVGAADYVVGGRYVEQDKMDSLVGRVGFRIGKDTSKGNVYARASYLYDFDGESSVTFSDGAKANRTIEQDLGGGWFEVGVGANYKLSDATNLYLDVEKTFGGEVDVNWQWNAGVRYSF